MQTFKAKWEEFRDKVIHPEKRNEVQVENFRRVFYGGALAVMVMLEKVDLEDPSEVTAVIKLMHELQDAAKEFTNDRPEFGKPSASRKEF